MKKTILRQQAEEKLGKQKSAAAPETEADTMRLLHELQVHQIELEMQNEELVQARAEVEAALGQYTELYDLAPVGYFTLARDGTISKVNLAGANLLGADTKRDKLIQRRFGIFVSAELRPQFSAFLDKVFTSGKNEACEIELLNHGAHAPLWVHLEATTDSDEREVCRLVAVDISERKIAEEYLEKFKQIVASTSEGISLLDTTYRYVIVNKAYETFSGKRKEELIGVTVAEYLGEAVFYEHIKPQFDKCLNGETIRYQNWFEYPTLGKRFVEVTYYPYIDARGKISGVVANTRDITERKQAEEALRKSEVEFRMLAEAMPQIVWVCQPDGKNIYFNQQWVDYTGLTLEESYGDGWNKPFHPEDQQRSWDAWQNATNNIAEYSLECRLRRADGIYTWWLVRGVPLVDEHGRVIKWFGTCTDINKLIQVENEIRQLNANLEQRVEERTRELREAQDQLVLKEKLAVLGQLASGMGHELRNPLTVINNAIYYLNLVQPNADEKVRQYHAIIKQEVHHAEKLINDLLNFANVTSADREPVSVSELVRRALEHFPVLPPVKLTLEIPADLPKVFVDSYQMEQALGNLVTNAWQAMIDGGELVISGQCSVISEKPFVSIHVRDSGTGITPENMKRLFEPLFTTKTRSIGMGLAVSKKLVEANDGRIEVESEAGKGSMFTVYLPEHKKII